MNADTSRDLVASIQGIKTNTTTDSLLPGGPIYSFVDSTTPHIYLPVDACQAFEKAFGLVWDPTWELYIVDNDVHDNLLHSNPSVTFTVGSQTSGGDTVDIELPYGAFDMNVSFPFINSTAPPYLNSARYFPLKQAANDTQYTLGRTFLQEAYLITDYEQKNFSLSQRNFTRNTQSNLQTILPAGYKSSESNKSSSISGGAIAGIAAGIVAVIAILAALVFFIRRYNQMKKRAAVIANRRDPTSSHASSRDEYYPLDRKSGIIEPPPRHPSRIMSEKDSATRYEMPMPGKGSGHNRNDSSEVVGTEVAKELHAEGTRGGTWEADSSARFELPGSEAPLGMSEKLGGARLSGRSEENLPMAASRTPRSTQTPSTLHTPQSSGGSHLDFDGR